MQWYPALQLIEGLKGPNEPKHPLDTSEPNPHLHAKLLGRRKGMVYAGVYSHTTKGRIYMKVDGQPTPRRIDWYAVFPEELLEEPEIVPPEVDTEDEDTDTVPIEGEVQSVDLADA